MKQRQITVQIRLNAGLGARMEKVRVRQEISRASLLKTALAEYLDRLDKIAEAKI